MAAFGAKQAQVGERCDQPCYSTKISMFTGGLHLSVLTLQTDQYEAVRGTVGAVLEAGTKDHNSSLTPAPPEGIHLVRLGWAIAEPVTVATRLSVGNGAFTHIVPWHFLRERQGVMIKWG